VFALAAESGDAGCVAIRSQLSRSAVSASEQLGVQIGGGFGCRAAGDSGGILAPSGAGGGKLAVQPASDSISAALSVSSSSNLFRRLTFGLLLRGKAPHGFALGALAGIGIAGFPRCALGRRADALLLVLEPLEG
jgi:hypothetical protein